MNNASSAQDASEDHKEQHASGNPSNCTTTSCPSTIVAHKPATSGPQDTICQLSQLKSDSFLIGKDSVPGSCKCSNQQSVGHP